MAKHGWRLQSYTNLRYTVGMPNYPYSASIEPITLIWDPKVTPRDQNASKVYRLGTTSVYESSAEQTTPTLSHPSPLYCSFLSRVLFFFYLMPLLIFYPSPYPASFPSISLFFLFLIPLLILPLSHPSSSSFSSFF